jgi:pimeloyl-ACP methyl ester carboxylesterase
MQKIYCIPGLGADHRLFSRLNLNAELIPVKWIEAIPSDTPSSYATRLLDQIKEENPILMGVSLGGIISVEISKLIPTKKLFLISTIKTKKELPPYFSLVDHLPFDISKAASWFKNYGGMLKPIYNRITKEELELFNSMLAKTPDEFMNWGVRAVSHWDNEKIEASYFHIHGSMDLVFPKKWVKDYTEIKSGSHFMVVDKADQISVLINKELENLK